MNRIAHALIISENIGRGKPRGIRPVLELKRLKYAVKVQQGDGYFGWEEHAPYDAIIVTAAPDHLPQPLVKQLKDSGRLVIPIGPQGSWQTLWQFTRQGDDLQAVNLGGVAFVPLLKK
jgi:protein-L-isoaspartate(D-aspartate) O-methyltransferase